MNKLHEYTDEFFESIERGSIVSAKCFADFIVPLLDITSVLDVGCGRGAWLREWRNSGVTIARGVDGPYVREDSLLIPATDFRAIDLSQRFNIGERYDLVTCLEVAEHLPPSSSMELINSLVAHSELILFSAATPGQGGENHINERPLSFWQAAFAKHGYSAFDIIRKRFGRDLRVEPWYRFNSILYAAPARAGALPRSFLETLVADTPIPEIGNLSWFARRSLLRLLPVQTVTMLAKWNYRRLCSTYQARAARITGTQNQ
ncbi:methyltransferase domain-containing protein [Bradyrhizobium genosp. A]|uniref:methyltransferase domain-containing protein n=1 Tax=Bradyrhizobium genosp. A TaxID=83626 RepID=UPI003CED9190